MKHRSLSRIVYFCVLVALLIGSALANNSDQTIYLSDVGMTISIPEEYTVFTRDVKFRDPKLDIIGMSRVELISLMKANDTYLYGFLSEDEWITVSMAQNRIKNFNEIPKTELLALADQIDAPLLSLGITIKSKSIYHRNQATYVVVLMEKVDNSATSQCIQYYTCVDNKAINIRYWVTGDELPSQAQEQMQSIVETINYGEPKPSPTITDDKVIQRGPFEYLDNQTTVSFLIPTDWEQIKLNLASDNVQAKFRPTDDEEHMLVYTRTDAWSMMDSSQKQGLSKEDLNSNLLSTAEIAEELDIDESRVSRESFGDNSFIIYSNDETAEVFGLDINLEITNAILMNDGVWYMFQYFGPTDGKYYNDFTEILKSLDFPTKEPAVNAQTVTSELELELEEEAEELDKSKQSEQPENPEQSEKKSNITVVFLLFGLLLIVIVGVICAIRRTLVKKEKGIAPELKVESEKQRINANAMMSEKPPTKSTTNHSLATSSVDKTVVKNSTCVEKQDNASNNQPRFCGKCGKPVLRGQVFCIYCGDKLDYINGMDAN